MKIELILTILYGRINLWVNYFCFLAGVIFSLIVNFMFSTSTSITLLSSNHVYKLHQPYLLRSSLTQDDNIYNPPPKMV